MKLKSNLLALFSRICAALLALLGYGCASKEEPDIPLMYGSPTGSFEIKGTVTNEEGAPISDAVIRVADPNVPSDLWSIARAVTNNIGLYYVTDRYTPVDNLKIVCIPIGNIYAPDSITVPVTYSFDETHEPDVWYSGHVDLTVDFKLKKKQEE